jgi:hypothetical protein
LITPSSELDAALMRIRTLYFQCQAQSKANGKKEQLPTLNDHAVFMDNLEFACFKAFDARGFKTTQGPRGLHLTTNKHDQTYEWYAYFDSSTKKARVSIKMIPEGQLFNFTDPVVICRFVAGETYEMPIQPQPTDGVHFQSRSARFQERMKALETRIREATAEFVASRQPNQDQEKIKALAPLLKVLNSRTTPSDMPIWIELLVYLGVDRALLHELQEHPHLCNKKTFETIPTMTAVRVKLPNKYVSALVLDPYSVAFWDQRTIHEGQWKRILNVFTEENFGHDDEVFERNFCDVVDEKQMQFLLGNLDTFPIHWEPK